MHHRVESIMGMPILIDVYDDRVSAKCVDAAFDWLRRVDAMFSTYRPDSEISRLNRRELAIDRCSPLVRSVLFSCERLRARTDGWFDHVAAGAALNATGSPPTGAGPGCGGNPGTPRVDPSGYVKGWAIDGVADILEQGGARNYCAEAAGDMRLAGVPAGEPCWRIGIRHPLHADEIALVLHSSGRCAVATSGTYARGEHIIDPRSGSAPRGVLSVTVVGDGDLATADALATAIFAMGADGPAWAGQHAWPYAAAVIEERETVQMTAALERWLEPERNSLNPTDCCTTPTSSGSVPRPRSKGRSVSPPAHSAAAAIHASQRSMNADIAWSVPSTSRVARRSSSSPRVTATPRRAWARAASWGTPRATLSAATGASQSSTIPSSSRVVCSRPWSAWP
jgi:thiamine biosynthesis lipoprotein